MSFNLVYCGTVFIITDNFNNVTNFVTLFILWVIGLLEICFFSAWIAYNLRGCARVRGLEINGFK